MNQRLSTVEIILFVRDQHGESLLSSLPLGCGWDFRDVEKCSDDLASGCDIDI